MGRYVPPELEGTTSFNAASGKGHALGARARKLKSEGILIVRFELPFAVWCTGCKPEQIIGQGVRFNAEKKKVGNYYSTPIWSFRFKHTTCSGWIEVRTDPKNAAYVVTEGGRRRDTGEDRLAEGEIRIGATEEEKARLEKEGAFGALEKRLEDKSAAATQQKRLGELLKRSDRDWDDPFENSKRLRAHFRAGRNVRTAAANKTESLKDKLSLGIELVEENPDDAFRASLVEFRHEQLPSQKHGDMFTETTPATSNWKDRGKCGKKLSPADILAAQKARLTSELQGNTRAGKDPFLVNQGVIKEPWRLSVKAKDKAEVTSSQLEKNSAALVNYDYDSD